MADQSPEGLGDAFESAHSCNGALAIADTFANSQIQAELKSIVPEYIPDAVGATGASLERFARSVTSAS